MEMIAKSRWRAVSGLVAAVLTGLAGIVAFNVIDGVFGPVEAIVGLLACIALTVVVFRRSPAKQDADA
jgi:uncharacterized membrane protein YuzA (DUF378 family)